MAELNLDMLTVMSAMSSDEAKARVFAEIATKAQELLDLKTEVQKQVDEAKAEREAARQDRLAAESARFEVGNREAAVAAETEGLANAHKVHAAEVEAYGKMRAQIDADHGAREESLREWEGNRAALIDVLARRSSDLEAREAAVKASEDSLSRKHAALTQAMSA